MRSEVARNEATLNVRLPAALMAAVRAKAKTQDIACARQVRMVQEADLQPVQ
ncbi:CopG family antitoxin [Comamonas flocculans]|uniref:Uncharacterized protein n=1 Tax=Comamonas flocculans TaxID=2597701 RepID=A0A5B8RZA1_9BURK|nr:CopG family antitoxin [Comamonas flocculans]QEA13227.1 hypothetical protein FOZ74_09410 [Comamonas flocculans]